MLHLCHRFCPVFLGYVLLVFLSCIHPFKYAEELPFLEYKGLMAYDGHAQIGGQYKLDETAAVADRLRYVLSAALN